MTTFFNKTCKCISSENSDDLHTEEEQHLIEEHNN